MSILPGLGKGEPERENKLEGIEEREVVHNADGALEDTGDVSLCRFSAERNCTREEGKDDPVGQPLGVVGLARAEESLHRVVTRNDKAGQVSKEGAADIEDDEEEVDADEADESVDLGDGSLALQIDDNGVLRQLHVMVSQALELRAPSRRLGNGLTAYLLIEGRDVVLRLVLERHGGFFAEGQW